MPNASASKKAHGKYTSAHIAFLRILIEQEKCTYEMVFQLTKMPVGTIGHFCSVHRIFKTDTSRASSITGRVQTLRKARKVARLRQKYGDALSNLFNFLDENV